MTMVMSIGNNRYAGSTIASVIIVNIYHNALSQPLSNTCEVIHTIWIIGSLLAREFQQFK
jgi:hypothetical protein